MFANAEALEHLRAALALGHPDRTGLQTAIGDLQTVMGDYADALVSLETAAAGSDPTTWLRSSTGSAGCTTAAASTRWPRRTCGPRWRPLRSATPRAAPASPRTSAWPRTPRATGRARGRWPEQARALAEQAGDPQALCQAHNLLGMLATADGDIGAALEHLQRSRDLADRARRPRPVGGGTEQPGARRIAPAVTCVRAPPT